LPSADGHARAVQREAAEDRDLADGRSRRLRRVWKLGEHAADRRRSDAAGGRHAAGRCGVRRDRRRPAHDPYGAEHRARRRAFRREPAASGGRASSPRTPPRSPRGRACSPEAGATSRAPSWRCGYWSRGLPASLLHSRGGRGAAAWTGSALSPGVGPVVSEAAALTRGDGAAVWGGHPAPHREREHAFSISAQRR
jgi:hypothetical protein